MGLRRSRSRSQCIHLHHLRDPILQELLGLRLGLHTVRPLDRALRLIWKDLYPGTPNSEARWDHSHEACGVGGSDEHALVVHHCGLLDAHLVPWQADEDNAHRTCEGLGDDRADCGGQESPICGGSRLLKTMNSEE